MMRLLIQTSLVLLVLNHALTPCEALRSSRGYGSKSKTDQSSGPKLMAGNNAAGLPPSNTPRRGLGLSAWGIVALTVFLILAGMGLYYFVTCYPIICQKQSKYNMMGLTPV